MIVDDPEVLAEVTAAFQAYEQALMDNDLAALDALFWRDPKTLRYGVGENLYGFEAIAQFRQNRPGGSPQRQLRRTIITCFGQDFAIANTEFIRENSTKLGRQSQTWVRMPEGWRIVGAHVSMLAEHS